MEGRVLELALKLLGEPNGMQKVEGTMAGVVCRRRKPCKGKLRKHLERAVAGPAAWNCTAARRVEPTTRPRRN